MISPLLANVYLHYVFDLWAERWRRREATGDMIIVRYADDIVVGFEHEADARRFRDAMRERLEEFALSLHPDKTRLIEFGRHAAARRDARARQAGDLRLPGLHLHLRHPRAAASRSSGRAGATACGRGSGRSRRSCGDGGTSRSPCQGLWLRRVVTGFFAYHGVPTNGRALAAFRFHVLDLWRRTLRRRSQRIHLTWERMARLADPGSPGPGSFTPGRSSASPPGTRGGSRMRETCTYGSVRGARDETRILYRS